MAYWDEIYNKIRSETDPAKLSQFAIPSPGPIDMMMMKYSGQDPNQLLKLKELQLDEAYKKQAAPIQADADNLKRMALTDPFIGSEEGRKDFADRPGFWLGTQDTGVVNGKKGASPVTAAGSNPEISKITQNFGNENANILTRFKAQNRDPMALASLDKEQANNFKDSTQGLENVSKVEGNDQKTEEAADKLDREKAALDYYINTPVTTDPTDMERFKAGLMKVAKTADVAKPLLERFAKANNVFADMSEADLTLKSLGTGPEAVQARQVLDLMQARKIQTSLASRPPKSETNILQSPFVDVATGQPMVFDKATGSYRVAPVTGGGGITAKPGAMSPEAATRAQQFDTVIAGVPKIRELVFDKDGKVNKVDIANAAMNTPLTKGRKIRQEVKRTVEQTLRIATGAAAPDSEVKSYTDMYAPQMGDTPEMIDRKLQALYDFASGARDKYNTGRSPQAISGGNKAQGTVIRYDSKGRRQ